MEDKNKQIEHLPRLPFTAIVCGSTMSGKTEFVKNLLLNWDDIYPGETIRKLLIVYSFFQNAYRELQDKFGEKCIFTTNLTPELLSEKTLGNKNDGLAVILLDDIAHKVQNNPLLTELYIGTAHHLNICPMLVCQNFFASRHPNWVTLTRNCNAIFLFSLTRDQNTLLHLGKQLFPTKQLASCLIEAYQCAFDDLKKAGFQWPYLFIDCQLHTDPRHRLKTGLLPGEPKLLYSVLM